MALNIKNDEVDRLARQLAAATGESLTEAVARALQERLDRSQSAQAPGIAERVRRLAAEGRALPVLDDRPAEEILGYDEIGLPH